MSDDSAATQIWLEPVENVPPPDRQRLPLGEIPEWFLAIAAVVYASGFLVVLLSRVCGGCKLQGLSFSESSICMRGSYATSRY